MSKNQTSETIELGIVLALSGGFMDAYSYICRGKVFANAQTGNMLLLGIKLTKGEFNLAFKYLLPVIAFSLGILISDIIRHLMSRDTKKLRNLHWRQVTVLVEIVLLTFVCFIPLSHNIIANSITSMACGMQVESFRKIQGNGIATTMCIGNLRSATQHFYSFLRNKDSNFLKKSLLYYFIIFCFIVGAIIGDICIDLFAKNAMFVCNIFLMIGFVMMFEEEKESIFKVF